MSEDDEIVSLRAKLLESQIEARRFRIELADALTDLSRAIAMAEKRESRVDDSVRKQLVAQRKEISDLKAALAKQNG
jgi:hypothetical protein